MKCFNCDKDICFGWRKILICPCNLRYFGNFEDSKNVAHSLYFYMDDCCNLIDKISFYDITYHVTYPFTKHRLCLEIMRGNSIKHYFFNLKLKPEQVIPVTIKLIKNLQYI